MKDNAQKVGLDFEGQITCEKSAAFSVFMAHTFVLSCLLAVNTGAIADRRNQFWSRV